MNRQMNDKGGKLLCNIFGPLEGLHWTESNMLIELYMCRRGREDIKT